MFCVLFGSFPFSRPFDLVSHNLLDSDWAAESRTQFGFSAWYLQLSKSTKSKAPMRDLRTRFRLVAQCGKYCNSLVLKIVSSTNLRLCVEERYHRHERKTFVLTAQLSLIFMKCLIHQLQLQNHIFSRIYWCEGCCGGHDKALLALRARSPVSSSPYPGPASKFNGARARTIATIMAHPAGLQKCNVRNSHNDRVVAICHIKRAGRTCHRRSHKQFACLDCGFLRKISVSCLMSLESRAGNSPLAPWRCPTLLPPPPPRSLDCPACSPLWWRSAASSGRTSSSTSTSSPPRSCCLLWFPLEQLTPNSSARALSEVFLRSPYKLGIVQNTTPWAHVTTLDEICNLLLW